MHNILIGNAVLWERLSHVAEKRHVHQVGAYLQRCLVGALVREHLDDRLVRIRAQNLFVLRFQCDFFVAQAIGRLFQLIVFAAKVAVYRT